MKVNNFNKWNKSNEGWDHEGMGHDKSDELSERGDDLINQNREYVKDFIEFYTPHLERYINNGDLDGIFNIMESTPVGMSKDMDRFRRSLEIKYEDAKGY